MAEMEDLSEEERADEGEVEEEMASLSPDEEEGDTGVEEALRAWVEGGQAALQADEGEISPIEFPQLEPGVPKVKTRLSRLNNVMVTITIELGRKEMTVRELSRLKEQDIIELDKLAGESFEIRVNGRLFALGEVVVVTDMMAVRITNLVASTPPQELEEG